MVKLNFIDLRKYFKELRDNVGFKWIALRSVDLTKPCTECERKMPDNYDQPYAGCKRCIGIGYLYVDKLIKGYRYQNTPGMDVSENVGLINVQSQIYLLQHDSQPKPVDWILELQLNEKTLIPVQPFKIVSAFKINDSTPLRGDDGRIEFWRCVCEEKNFTIGKGLI